MRNPGITLFILISSAFALIGCSESVWDKSPNYSGSAVVEKIEKDTRWSKATGSSSTIYTVKLANSDPADLGYVKVSGGKIEDADMARSIGKRVAIKCYRADPSDYCYASSYNYEGR